MPTHPADMELRCWMVDAVGHRRYQMDMARQAEESGFLMVVVDPGDEWVCDWCNGDIPTVWENGLPRLIAMLGEDAICPECVTGQLYEGEKRLRDEDPAGPGWWSDRICGCPPCIEEVPRWLAKYNRMKRGGVSFAT